VNTKKGPELQPVKDRDTIKVGDELVVRIELRTDRETDLLAIVEPDAVRVIDEHPQDAVLPRKLRLQIRQLVAEALDGWLQQCCNVVGSHSFT